jgi:hypothetical protein
MKLEFIILGDDFNDFVDDLFLLTKKHPQLNITLKGTGIIAQGKLHT